MALALPSLRPENLKPGERTDPSGKAIRNIILLRIPDGEYAAIRPHLGLIRAPYHRVLYEPRQRIDFGYFPNTGIISQVITTTDGRSVEAGIVGSEGFLGASLAVGIPRSQHQAISQVPGEGLKVRASALVEILEMAPALRFELNHFAQIQAMLICQSAACNRLHSIEQRLARWILMSQDRLDSPNVPLTHEFLAEMLGSGRPSVSLAAAMLQRSGLIEYARGKIRVVHRHGLESAACECYGIIQRYNGELSLSS